MTAPEIVETISPRADLFAAYDDRYEQFRGYYRALSPAVKRK